MDDAESVMARFSLPRSRSRTRIGVLADLHLSLDSTGSWRVSHRTLEHLEAVVRSLNERTLDGVLFVGDLTGRGTRSEYEAFDEAISDLDAPFYAIPGNHDFPLQRQDDPGISLETFEDRYTPGGLPFLERIGGVDVVGLNSNRTTRESLADTFQGQVSADALEWLGEAVDDPSNTLAMVHHNLPGIRSFYENAQDDVPVDGGSPGFENAKEVLGTLRTHSVPLVLTGHLHVPSVATEGDVREFSLPSLGPFPNAYTVLDIGESGTTAYVDSVADFEGRLESFGLGMEQDRVVLTAVQMSDLPIHDESA